MARGRMLSGSISESHQVASLPDHLTRLIFTWLLAHADAMGRYSAHPMVIGGKVLTLLGIGAESIIQALVAMHVAGLIWLYEAGGQPYLVFLGWERHQTIRHDREKAKCPDPTSMFPAAYLAYLPEHLRDDAGTMPGVFPENDRVSSKEVQAKDQVEAQEQAITGSVGSSQPAYEYESLLGIYNAHRGALAEVQKLSERRRDGLAALVKEHGLEEAGELLADATKFIATDPFWFERKFNLDNLLSSPGRVLEKAEKFRALPTKSATNDQYERLGL